MARADANKLEANVSEKTVSVRCPFYEGDKVLWQVSQLAQDLWKTATRRDTSTIPRVYPHLTHQLNPKIFKHE